MRVPGGEYPGPNSIATVVMGTVRRAAGLATQAGVEGVPQAVADETDREHRQVDE